MNMHRAISLDYKPEDARFTIAQLYALHEQDLLTEWRRIELIAGEIRLMAPQHMPHMWAKLDLFRALDPVVTAAGYELGMEASVELGDEDLPMPDLFVHDPVDVPYGLPGRFAKIVIEVAESSEKFDLGEKLELYAAYDIPEYWVVRVKKRIIERFADPQGVSYRTQDSFGFDEAVPSVTLPSVVLPGQWFRH